MKSIPIKVLLLAFILSTYDLSLNAQNFLSAFNDGGVGHELLSNIASHSGNTYATGTFSNSTVTFNGGLTLNNTVPNLSPSGTPQQQCIFLVKYNPAGIAVWAHAIGGVVGGGRSEGIAVDDGGNVYVTGILTDQNVNFGSGAGQVTITLNPNTQNFFLAKYDSNGNFLWVIGGTGLSVDVSRDVTVDVNGNPIITGGFFSNQLNLTLYNGGPPISLISLTNTYGPMNLNQAWNEDLFVAKFTPNGALSFAVNHGNPGIFMGGSEGLAVSSNSAGEIYLVGTMQQGNFNYGSCISCNITSSATGNANDALILKLGPTGTSIWALNPIANGVEGLLDIACDMNDDIYVTGGYVGNARTINGISGPLLPANPSNSILVKLDPLGVGIWASIGNITGINGFNHGNSITVDNCGYVYASGEYYGTSIDFNGNTLNTTNNSSTSSYIYKSDLTNGNTIWASQPTTITTSAVIVNSTTLDHNRNLVMGGPFVGSVTIPPSFNQTLIAPSTRAESCLATIEGPSIPNGSIVVEPTCERECNGIITVGSISGMNPPYQYRIDGGPWQTSNIFTGLCDGTYLIEVIGGPGCGMVSITVVVPAITDPWPKHPITNGNQAAEGRSVAFDEYGGRFMTGNFDQQIEFQNLNPNDNVTLLSNNGSRDGFLARYDDCGIDWAFEFGSTNSTAESGSVIRHAFSVSGGQEFIVLGANIQGTLPASGFQGASGPGIINPVNNGSVNLTTSAINTTSKGLIAVIDALTGQVVWVYMIGDQPGEVTRINDIRISETGVIYAIGDFQGSMSSGAITGTSLGGWDIFVLEIDLAGNYLSSNYFGTAGDDGGQAIDLTIDASQKTLFATGFVSDQNVFFGPNITVPGIPGNGMEVYLARFLLPGLATSSIDVHQGPGDDFGSDVNAPAQLGQYYYYITGSYNDQIVFNDGTNTMAANIIGGGNTDAFILAYDSQHQLSWLRSDGGNTVTDAGTVLTRTDNHIYMGGFYTGTSLQLDFLTGLSSSLGTTDMFITQFNFNGTGATTIGIPGDGPFDLLTDIELKWQNLYTTGSFSGPNTTFNATLNANSLNNDAFFARMDQTLTFFRRKPIKDALRIENIQADYVNFKVYPNPSNGAFQLDLGRISDRTMTRLFNVNGQVLMEKEWTGMEVINFQINQTPGLYILEVQTNNHDTEFIKIVKE